MVASAEMISENITAFKGFGTKHAAVWANTGMLLLMSKQMCLALEFLSTLATFRGTLRLALSLHFDGTIVVGTWNFGCLKISDSWFLRKRICGETTFNGTGLAPAEAS